MPGDGPRFSICIPSRNRLPTLRHAVGSALVQTFRDLEVIVMDNASEPSAESLISELGDSRVRYFRNDVDVGSRENWELALSKARGDYALLLADDDALIPSALETVSHILAGRSRAFLQTGHVRYTHPLAHFDATALQNRLQNKSYSGALIPVDGQAVCRAIFHAWAIGSEPSPTSVPTDPHPSACYMATPVIREIRGTFGSLTVPPFADVGFLSAMLRSSEVLFFDSPLTVVGVDVNREINGPLPGRRRYYDSLSLKNSPTGMDAVTFTNLATGSHLEVLRRHEHELAGYASDLRDGFYVNHIFEILQDPVRDRRWRRDLGEAMTTIARLSPRRWPGIMLSVARSVVREVATPIAARRAHETSGLGGDRSPLRQWIPGQLLGFQDIQGCAAYVGQRVVAAKPANSFPAIRLAHPIP